MKLLRALFTAFIAGMLAAPSAARAAQTFVKVVQPNAGKSFADIQQVAADPDGTTWVAGVYQDKVDFGGGIVLTGADPTFKYPFLGKQDVNGGWIWVKTITGGPVITGYSGTPASRSDKDLTVTSMVVSDDSIYLTGVQARYQESLEGRRAKNSFLMKVDKSGAIAWIRDFVSDTLLTSVVVGPDGNIYVGGSVSLSYAVFNGVTSIDKGAAPDREAAVFKFNPSGGFLWKVFCGGTARPDEHVAGLAADGVNIHVVLNMAGTPGLFNTGGTTAVQTFNTLVNGMAPIVATLSTSGSWVAGTYNLLEARDEFRGFSPAGLTVTQAAQLIAGATSLGTDIQLIGGKIYVSGSYLVAERSGSPVASPSGSIKQGGFLVRLRADTHSPDGPVAYFRSPNDDHLSTPYRIRGLDNQIFVTGNMKTTLRVHEESANTTTPVGTIDAEATSVVPNRFVAKFNKDLNPAWLKTTSAANNIKAPGEFSAFALGFDDTNQRLYWGGQFRTSGTDKLALGASPNIVQLTSTLPAGWLTALDSDGGYLGQATLRVESTYSPVNVNGADVTAPVEFVFFRSTSTRIKAASSESNGTRRIVTGYSINNVPAAATGDDILMDVLEDTTVEFQWKTQHKLTVVNEVDTALGINSDTLLGNVQPGLGSFWYDDGTTVNAAVDGIIVASSDAASAGTRLVLSQYSAGATGLPFQPRKLTTPTARVAIPTLTMVSPNEIRLLWKKQISVNVTHASDFGRELLMTRSVDGQGNEITGSRTLTRGGEVWFDAGANIEVGAMETDGKVTLKGWQYSAPVGPGGFTTFSFKASPDVTDDRKELLAAALKLKTLSVNGRSVNYLVNPISNLTQPVRVLWDYDNAAYVFHVAVGDTLTLTGTPALAPGKWTNARVVDGPPGSTGDNMLVWDEKAQKAVAARPGIVLLEWLANNGTDKVVTQVFMGFNGDPWQDDATKLYAGPAYFNHIANTPPVELDPSPGDSRMFKALLYATDDGTVAGSKFSATRAGRSILLFYTSTVGVAVGDPLKENVEVRVVRTKVWNDTTVLSTALLANIGQKLTGGSADKAGLGTGYVMHEVSNYNPDVYDRKNVKGPIIPVNQFTGVGMGGTTPTDKDLVVVWYENSNGILWPYQPVYYRGFVWPQQMRIVIASRLGSEGVDVNGNPQFVFDPAKYSDVKIYNQPDRSKPGFNPNEEHARIYPSLYQGLTGKNIPAAFALRNDLNIKPGLISVSGGSLTTADTTSEPFVLVQYTDNTGTAPETKMAVYAVQREDATANDPRVLELPGAVAPNYTFTYKVQAGELITAPYPLNLVMGLKPCLNTVAAFFPPSANVPNGSYFEDGGAQRTWFIDHKNGAWCVSGGSSFTGRFFYRLAEDFYYPFKKTGSEVVRAVGDCMPLLPKLDLSAALANKDMSVFDVDSRTRSEPVAINYQTVWPENLPVLKVGETLTYAGGENKADNPDDPGLPGVIGFAAGEVVFDSRNPQMVSSQHASQFMARIIEPLEERLISLPTASLPGNLNTPASPDVTVEGDTWYFNKLPPSLQKRVFFKPLAKINKNDSPGVLGLRGYVNDRTLGAGDLTAAPPPVYVLEPNVLTATEVLALKAIRDPNAAPSPGQNWESAIDQLHALSRNPNAVPGSGWLSSPILRCSIRPAR